MEPLDDKKKTRQQPGQPEDHRSEKRGHQRESSDENHDLNENEEIGTDDEDEEDLDVPAGENED